LKWPQKGSEHRIGIVGDMLIKIMLLWHPEAHEPSTV
jgi:hypothetical protein